MALTPDLAELLDDLNPQADLAQRHLWLIELLDWVRGSRNSVPRTLARVRFDAEWLTALDDMTLARLLPASCDNINGGVRAWVPQTGPSRVSPWQATLLEALTLCTCQIRATGFSPEPRLGSFFWPAPEPASKEPRGG